MKNPISAKNSALVPVQIGVRLHRVRALLAQAKVAVSQELDERTRLLKDWEASRLQEVRNSIGPIYPDINRSSGFELALGTDSKGNAEPYHRVHLFTDNIIFLSGSKKNRLAALRHCLAGLFSNRTVPPLRLAIVDPDLLGMDIGPLSEFIPGADEGRGFIVKAEEERMRGRSGARNQAQHAPFRLPESFFKGEALANHSPATHASARIILILRTDDRMASDILRDTRLETLVRQQSIQVIVDCGNPEQTVKSIDVRGICPVVLSLGPKESSSLRIRNYVLEGDDFSPSLMSEADYTQAVQRATKANAAPLEFQITPATLKERLVTEPERRKVLSVPIGIEKDRNIIDFRLDEQNSAHTLIVGTNGSGKTTFITSVLKGLSFNYSPEELEIRIFELGGVSYREFESYPHLSQFICTADVETAVAALGSANLEFRRRAALFQEAGVASLSSYNGSEMRLPRIVYVIDELQNVYIGASSILRSQASDILESLVKQGRKMGMHFIFATQTLKGFPVALRNTIASQTGNRYLLKLADEDAQLFIDELPRHFQLAKGPPDCSRVGLNGESPSPFKFALCNKDVFPRISFQPKASSSAIIGEQWSIRSAIGEKNNDLALDLGSCLPFKIDPEKWTDDTLVVLDGERCAAWLFNCIENVWAGSEMHLVCSDESSLDESSEFPQNWKRLSVTTVSGESQKTGVLVFWDRFVPNLIELLQYPDRNKPALGRGDNKSQIKRIYLIRSAVGTVSKNVEGFRNRFLLLDSPLNSKREAQHLCIESPYTGGNRRALLQIGDNLSTVLIS